MFFKVHKKFFGSALAADLLESGLHLGHISFARGHAYVIGQWLDGPGQLPSQCIAVTALEVALECAEILPASDGGSYETLLGYDPIGSGRWTARVRRLRRDAVRMVASFS